MKYDMKQFKEIKKEKLEKVNGGIKLPPIVTCPIPRFPKLW